MSEVKIDIGRSSIIPYKDTPRLGDILTIALPKELPADVIAAEVGLPLKAVANHEESRRGMGTPSQGFIVPDTELVDTMRKIEEALMGLKPPREKVQWALPHAFDLDRLKKFKPQQLVAGAKFDEVRGQDQPSYPHKDKVVVQMDINSSIPQTWKDKLLEIATKKLRLRNIHATVELVQSRTDWKKSSSETAIAVYLPPTEENMKRVGVALGMRVPHLGIDPSSMTMPLNPTQELRESGLVPEETPSEKLIKAVAAWEHIRSTFKPDTPPEKIADVLEKARTQHQRAMSI